MSARLKYINNWLELAEKAKWSGIGLSKMCGVSTRTLHRYFIEEFEMTPRCWLKLQRQRKGFELLNNGLSVKATAFQLGYRSSEAFSREFKRNCGKPPSRALPHLRVILYQE
jgi:methylphosphotriester-DNA--protein-cysteine methyltransferase